MGAGRSAPGVLRTDKPTSEHAMRNVFPLKWLWLTVSIFVGLTVVVPTRVQAQQSVSDWLAFANEQISRDKPGTALVVFGKIAARHPNYVPAQVGLQKSFAKFGSIRRSEAFLRYALAKDPTHEPALLAAWQALDRAHPLRFSASASLLPSSNVDHVASERYLVTDFGTFLIDNGGNETSGVGLGFGMNMDWVIQPRPGHRVRFRATYAGAWFHSAALRYAEPSLAVRYEHLGGRNPWSLEAALRKRRYGGAAQDVTSDNITRAISFSKSWRQVGGRRTFLRITGEYSSYLEKPYLTGPRYSIDLGRRNPLGRRGHLSYGVRLERALPRTDYHRYSGAELRIGYERPLLEGLRGGLSLSYGERSYDADFPIVGERRHDRSASLGLSVALRQAKILGQSPKISCTVRRTQSNVALYTTNSVDCALSLKLDF